MLYEQQTPSGEQSSVNSSAQAERDLAAENRSLEVFLGGLQTLWHSSQPRRRKPKPRTGKRSRPDPFEPDVELIEQWLRWTGFSGQVPSLAFEAGYRP